MAAKRGTYRRTESTRARIVAAAWQVMVERGFYGTSVALVAERSGMTRAGLMYHFATKEHLLVAVMEERFQKNGLLFTQHAEQGVSVLESFLEMARRRYEDPETATLLMVLAGASIDPANPAHEWFGDRYKMMQEGLTARVEEGQRKGELRRDVDASAIARHLTAMAEGLLLQWLNDPKAVDLVEVTKQYCDMVRAPDR